MYTGTVIVIYLQDISPFLIIICSQPCKQPTQHALGAVKIMITIKFQQKQQQQQQQQQQQ